MSKISIEQITNYLEKMVATLSGDRGRTAADLNKLLGMIRGDVEPGSPGVQPLKSVASKNVRMAPTAATPKPKAKAKEKVEAKTESKAVKVEENQEPDSEFDPNIVLKK